MSFSRCDVPLEPIFKIFNILKVKDQIALFNCLFIHNRTHNLLPSNFNDSSCLVQICMILTQGEGAGCLFTPQYSSNTYDRQSVQVSVILVWNNLCKTLDMVFLKLKKNALK